MFQKWLSDISDCCLEKFRERLWSLKYEFYRIFCTVCQQFDAEMSIFHALNINECHTPLYNDAPPYDIRARAMSCTAIEQSMPSYHSPVILRKF